MSFMLTKLREYDLEMTCMQPVTNDKKYSSFKKCMMIGYEASKILLDTIHKDDVNNKQIYVNFTCTEGKSI